MQDIYAAIVGEPPTEQEKIEALARKLRGQQMVGQLGMLTGDKVLAPMGQRQVDQAGDQAAKIANRALVRDQMAGAAASRAQQAEQFAKEQEFTAQQNALERAMRLELERMQQVGADARDKKVTDRLDAAEKKELDRYTRALQSDIDKSNIPFLDSAFKDLETALSPFVDPATGKPKKDVPGIGATSLAPMGTLSAEGRPVRQAVANVRNQFLKMASGAAVTNPEAARLYEQIAMQLGGSDEDVLRGLESLKQMRDSAKSNIYAGYDPLVVETYENRRKQIFPGTWGGSAQAPAAAAADPNRVLTPEEWKAQKAGKK